MNDLGMGRIAGAFSRDGSERGSESRPHPRASSPSGLYFFFYSYPRSFADRPGEASE